jgi:SNF2 family DNA or RNA helicase
MVKELSKRAEAVHLGHTKLFEDNLLKITLDGKKIGIDQRLMNPLLPDDENSKVNMCMRNIYEIWEKTKENKLTQLMFCDFSTPKKNGLFNIYDDIKNKLVNKGIPENEIAYIHDANNENRKEELFDKVCKGQIRVLMGSTAKLGMGTNVQNRLVAIHELDCPWKPAEIEQREGRIIRQGNNNPEINIYRYVTESTFDAYLYQTIENKQKFISQIMTGKNP